MATRLGRLKVVTSIGVDKVRAALVALPGVGRCTAEYVGLRALNEPDAFPAGDLILRRVAGGTDAAPPRLRLKPARKHGGRGAVMPQFISGHKHDRLIDR
jgi:3-methyladenine DNA glycosylase/8-oxoguanine DNA glycosylase